jgi:glycosyltransferase involved in cell wall biosynthesis
MKRLVFTVTNDLNYDQRMIRICTSLNNAGYEVLLIGRKSPVPLIKKQFSQKRLFCFFNKGKLFYLEYNFRLFFFLLFTKLDLICAIDLDTIIPCYMVSILRRKKRVYDAHELFTEMKEVVSRPAIFRVWKWVEKTFVPRFKYGYTVNAYIRDILKKDYGVAYSIIRNIPVLNPEIKLNESENFILYQGAVNHGRSFETLIPAFQWINAPFFIYGNGNFIDEAKRLIQLYKLEDKVFLKGSVEPGKLRDITSKALLGITIFENQGLSNYYSLANRFFDYMHAGIPQLCVDYPAYREINEQYKVAVLITDLSAECIANTINEMLQNKVLQAELRANCLKAREVYNWQYEEKLLAGLYYSIFQNPSS